MGGSSPVDLVLEGLEVLLLLCQCCAYCSRSESRDDELHAPLTDNTTTTHAPYPRQQYAAPYIAAAVSPYPAAAAGGPPYPGAAPYPTHDAYPHPQPQPPTAPTDESPPSYEQVMGAAEKQPPYNPHAPH